jgi:hypothetical protein
MSRVRISFDFGLSRNGFLVFAQRVPHPILLQSRKDALSGNGSGKGQEEFDIYFKNKVQPRGSASPSKTNPMISCPDPPVGSL